MRAGKSIRILTPCGFSHVAGRLSRQRGCRGGVLMHHPACLSGPAAMLTIVAYCTMAHWDAWWPQERPAPAFEITISDPTKQGDGVSVSPCLAC